MALKRDGNSEPCGTVNEGSQLSTLKWRPGAARPDSPSSLPAPARTQVRGAQAARPFTVPPKSTCLLLSTGWLCPLRKTCLCCVDVMLLLYIAALGGRCRGKTKLAAAYSAALVSGDHSSVLGMREDPGQAASKGQTQTCSSALKAV